MGRTRYAQGKVKLTKTNLWQAIYYVYLVDPETGIEKRHKRTRIVGTKAKMKKYQADEELRKITHPINVTNGRVDETTLGGFMDKRWKPLHEGDWREESTRDTNLQLLDILRERWGDTPLRSLDKVEMQEWLNAIARKRSHSAILHLRIFLKSICAEAVEQDYLPKDPALKLKVPKTKAVDKSVLTWEQVWKVYAALKERDQLIVSLEVTAGIRPSELFALRRRSWDGVQLTISETVYRGVLREYGKTEGSTTTFVVAPKLRPHVAAWLAGLEDQSPEAFLFPNTEGGFITKDNYLRRVLYPVRVALGLKKLNFQVLRRTFSTHAQKHGGVKDIQRQLRHSKPEMSLEYIQPIAESVEEMVAELYDRLLTPKGRVQ